MQIMLNIRKWSMERPHRVQRHLSADADTKIRIFQQKKTNKKFGKEIWKKKNEWRRRNLIRNLQCKISGNGWWNGPPVLSAIYRQMPLKGLIQADCYPNYDAGGRRGGGEEKEERVNPK